MAEVVFRDGRYHVTHGQTGRTLVRKGRPVTFATRAQAQTEASATQRRNTTGKRARARVQRSLVIGDRQAVSAQIVAGSMLGLADNNPSVTEVSGNFLGAVRIVRDKGGRVVGVRVMDRGKLRFMKRSAFKEWAARQGRASEQARVRSPFRRPRGRL